jgi:RNA polymerase sigma-32 factor
MLTQEEETQLAQRLRDEDDINAAWRMVTSHLRFVVKLARGYKGYGLPQEDLIQEGNIGLIKAVRRFDPDIGVRLVSFAVHWVRAAMHEYILQNWRIVKVATTKAQRKLFFNLRRNKKRLGWLNNAEVNDVAEALSVKPEEVLEMEKRLQAHDAPFDSDDSSDDRAFAPADYLEGTVIGPSEAVEQEQWNSAHSVMLAEAMGELDERSKDIVTRRWIDEPKATLHDLADEYGVSAERIRQLEAKAFKKLRAALETI